MINGSAVQSSPPQAAEEIHFLTKLVTTLDSVIAITEPVQAIIC